MFPYESLYEFLAAAEEFVEAHGDYVKFQQSYEMHRERYGIQESYQQALEDQDLLVPFYSSLALMSIE